MALEVAQTRKKFLTPIFRKILSYAAKEPRAYECRFTSSLLNASAFCLSEWGDSEFLSLAGPLLSRADCPNLYGYHPEDSSRLVARAVRGDSNIIFEYLLDENCSAGFAEALLESLVYVVAWYPECRNEVRKSLISLLRNPILSEFSEHVHQALVESCCRIGSTEFLFDLHFASEEGKISEGLIDRWIAARDQADVTGVWIDANREVIPISLNAPFLLEYLAIIDAGEIYSNALSVSERVALVAFNSVSAPCSDLRLRIVEVQSVHGIAGISSRVIRLAADNPKHFRAQHWHTAVTSAICLGSIIGGADVAKAFARLLQVSDDGLDILLGNDLTEMCDLAFALAARDAPTEIYRVIEDISASFSSRSVAMEALYLQVQLGYLQRSDLSKYINSLFERREIIVGGPSFWYDVAKIGAQLSMVEIIPLLRDLVQLGVFIEPDGTMYANLQDLDELFAKPPQQIQLPDAKAIDAGYLLNRCSGHESVGVAEFFSNLEAPSYVK